MTEGKAPQWNTFSSIRANYRPRLEKAGRDPDSVDVQVVCPQVDFGDMDTVRTFAEFVAAE
ncbi:hypothetical protein [Nocardia wallacei]|uniref:hypothetical protein n=1 Tax=Nocardia wallacei TaxID=480035 RepID=UPI00245780F4|nr:hypothetical protein [Nocardia wallacei]